MASFKNNYLKSLAKDIEKMGDFPANEIVDMIKQHLADYPEDDLSGDFDEDLDIVAGWLGY